MFYLYHSKYLSLLLRNPDKDDILIADSFLRGLYMPQIIAQYSKHWLKVEINKWINNCHQYGFSSYNTNLANVNHWWEGGASGEERDPG